MAYIPNKLPTISDRSDKAESYHSIQVYEDNGIQVLHYINSLVLSAYNFKISFAFYESDQLAPLLALTCKCMQGQRGLPFMVYGIFAPYLPTLTFPCRDMKGQGGVFISL